MPAAGAVKSESEPSYIPSAIHAASRIGKADETTVKTDEIAKEVATGTAETTSGGSDSVKKNGVPEPPKTKVAQEAKGADSESVQSDAAGTVKGKDAK